MIQSKPEFRTVLRCMIRSTTAQCKCQFTGACFSKPAQLACPGTRQIGNPAVQISRIKLKNWRNFGSAEASKLADVSYILGPNASGKSNLLDAVRFLRDVAKTKGGGLQDAIESRGGMKKLRCLHARRDTDVVIEVDVSNNDGAIAWTYELGFNLPPAGSREPEVKKECVWRFDNGRKRRLLNRPDSQDGADKFRLRETHMEQISANSEFRELAAFFGDTTYVHLVPQLLKFGEQMGGRVLEEDPFGQEFMLRISRTPSKTRTARLKRIEGALQSIVPHLQDLQFVKDDVTGQPHLEIKFKHHRPHGARQREDQFSDGTLRLLSLLWLLQDTSNSPLLLEEPELSLNEKIVQQLARIISDIMRKSRSRRQILISTHSEALLSNPGIDPNGLILVEPSAEGSSLRKVSEEEKSGLRAGLSPAEVVLPAARRVEGSTQLLLEI